MFAKSVELGSYFLIELCSKCNVIPPRLDMYGSRPTGPQPASFLEYFCSLDFQARDRLSYCKVIDLGMLEQTVLYVYRCI